jgi:putative ABC transport system permease protein
MHFKEDVGYALRQFAAAPGFTITAVLTLALGIGATTAIFTLVDALMLKALPVARPSELYRVGDVENCCVSVGLQDDWSLFSYDKYRTFRDGTQGFAELAAFQAGSTLLGVRASGSAQPAESQFGEYVSGNYFSTFGISAYMGRLLTPQDDRKGAAPVAIMNYRTWQQKFGQDPSVVGASFLIDGHPFTVIGVTPPGFFGDRLQNPPAYWIPLSDEPMLNASSSILDLPEQDWLDLIGRINPGVDRKKVEAQMHVELQRWLLSPISQLQAEERALVPKQTLHLSPGGAGVRTLREEYQAGLRMLMAISAFVLLIACANVANLLLVRAANRGQQTSIRAALGAPRSRQIAQVLTESLVLALLGGILGVAVAFAGTRLILHLAFPKFYVAISATPSMAVLAFTFGVALVTGILFGVAPAWRTASADPSDALRGAGRSTAGRDSRTQESLVVGQAALSLILLCAAGLLIQSLRNLHHQHLGFETANRYILHIDPNMAGYGPAGLDAFYRQLHQNLAAIPGVAQVSFSLYSPMEGDNWAETVFLEGQAPPPPDSNQNEASWARVSEDYFETMGTKILAGRAFTDHDTENSRRVAVVNQTFAKKFLKGEDPIGKHFGDLDMKFAGVFEIVGVTEDTMYWRPTSKMRPMFFLPARQRVTYEDPRFVNFEDRSHYLNAIELKTMGSLPGLEPQVRRALAQVNPDLAMIDFNRFRDQVEQNFSQKEMIAKLTSLFGALALVLASVGLYGVTAYWVERRTREIGVRMALGADRLKVLQLVLRGAFLEVGIGLAIGIPVSIFAGRGMASELFGVTPYNPTILLGTTAVLSLAALVAALVPAHRAASLDPLRALRTD